MTSHLNHPKDQNTSGRFRHLLSTSVHARVPTDETQREERQPRMFSISLQGAELRGRPDTCTSTSSLQKIEWLISSHISSIDPCVWWLLNYLLILWFDTQTIALLSLHLLGPLQPLIPNISITWYVLEAIRYHFPSRADAWNLFTQWLKRWHMLSNLTFISVRDPCIVHPGSVSGSADPKAGRIAIKGCLPIFV